MKMICLALALLALGLPVFPADYYCNPAGSDTGTGSQESPFQTLARGVQALANNSGDRLFITGRFQESLVVNKSRVSVIGLGDAVIEGVSTGIFMDYQSGNTIENIVVRNCSNGLIVNGAGHLIRRIRFLENVTGKGQGFLGLNTTRFVECDWAASNNVGVLIASEFASIYERCTLYGNNTAITFGGNSTNVVIRNCIVAGNTTGFLDIPSAFVLDYNLTFDNGGAGGPRNYVGTTPGPHDLQQRDPRFVDASAFNLALESDSPALNAGRDSLGNPVTIGSHEIGVLNSGGAAANVPFSSWVSAGDGKPVTDPTAQVVLDADGNLALNAGVMRGVAVSPVIDLGQAGARLTRVDFHALEDLDQPSGSKKVIDQDDATFVRTFRIRGADATFDPLGPSPAWLSTTNRADLAGLRNRFVQMEFTLTRQGR